MLPSVILNSCVRSMLGTCRPPSVKGVVAPGPPRKGFLIESLLALPDPPCSGRMTSFKVPGYRGNGVGAWSRAGGGTARWGLLGGVGDFGDPPTLLAKLSAVASVGPGAGASLSRSGSEHCPVERLSVDSVKKKRKGIQSNC